MGTFRRRHALARHGARRGYNDLPAMLEILEPRMLLSAELMWTLPDPPTSHQGASGFGGALAVDGNLAVVAASSADLQGVSDVGCAYVLNAATGELVATLRNPAPAESDRLGYSVAISGGIVVVGAPYDDNGATDAGSVYVFDAGTGNLLRTLSNPTPATGDLFGCSVAISGSTIVVGAYCDDTGATDSGSAYIFDAATGSLLWTLNNPTPGAGDYFGRSVAVSGSTVVVGAYRDDTGATDAGSAYVFDAGTGSLLRTLNDPARRAGDNFGRSVAVSGGTIVVGVPNYGAVKVNSGCGYVFDAGTGNLLRTLLNPTPATSDYFGYSVAIAGSTVVVGAYCDDTGATDSGSAYVFDAGTGSLLSTLANPTAADGDLFGASVAVSGNTVVVSASSDDAGSPDSGTAYIFGAATGNLLRTLDNPTPDSWDRFGNSVAVSGRTVVVGAYGCDYNSKKPGLVYLYDAVTGLMLRALSNPTPAADDRFGWSVAISGSTVVVGAPYDDTVAPNAGAVYVFDAATGNLLRTLTDPARGSQDQFGYSVAVSGGTVVVGVPYDRTGAMNTGRAYVFDAVTGNLLSTLANPTPAGGDDFGMSVAVSGSKVVVGAPYAGMNSLGAAYLFDTVTGGLLATLTCPNPKGDYDDFGLSVAASGSTVVVGAHFASSAYVFDAATGNLLRTLNNPVGGWMAGFGLSVAVSGSVVVVGAATDDTGATDAGLAYLFDAGTGSLLGTLGNPAPSGQANYGWSVAVSDRTIVVAAPHEDAGTVDRGVAYIFVENRAPVAGPGGPYVAQAGVGLVLDGSASSDPDTAFGDSIVSYAWDLDNDGLFDDATGPTPAVTWAQLAGMPAGADLPVSLRVTDSFGATGVAATTLRIVPQVVGRYVFYNNSYWDGNDPAASAADDAAIAPDKQALLPGGTAAFVNYTSYFRGVNGVMIDVSDLPPGTPTAADFEFRAARNGDPATWPLAAGPASITVRRGAGVGGSDRVTLIWSDAAAVRNQWLRVTVRAGGGVGLAADDVFCFGSAPGDVGNSATDAKVDILDVSLTRENQTTYVNPPPITNPYDFNRDHSVNVLDISLARSGQTTYAIMAELISLPVEGALPPVVPPPVVPSAAGEEAGTWAARLAAQVADSPAIGRLGGVGVDVLAPWT